MPRKTVRSKTPKTPKTRDPAPLRPNGEPWQVPPVMRDRLKGLVRLYYDMQHLRIGAGNRINPTGEDSEDYLDAEAVEILGKVKKDFEKMEEAIIKVVGRVLRDVPIARWLQAHSGVAECMAGVLLSEISLIPVPSHTKTSAKTRCGCEDPGGVACKDKGYPEPFTTVSKLWKFCGLDTRDGKAPRLEKNVKAGFNPWLRAKVIAVLARNLIKTNSRAEPNEDKLAEINAGRAKKDKPAWTLADWRKEAIRLGFTRRIEFPWMDHAVYVKGPWAPVYYEYRHRLETRRVDVCSGCDGTGARMPPDATAEEKREDKKRVECWNCEGTGGPCAWGCGADHRDAASARYLAKMFIAAFLVEYRTEEGLPVRPSFQEEKQGRAHGGAGAGAGARVRGNGRGGNGRTDAPAPGSMSEEEAEGVDTLDDVSSDLEGGADLGSGAE